MHRLPSFLTPVVLLLLVCPVHGQTRQTPKFSAKVQLIVSEGSTISGEVVSYLSRELRTLNGITLDDSDPNWVLSVVVLPLESESGARRGVAFSVVVTRPFHRDVFKVLSGLQPYQKDFIDVMTEGLDSVEAHWLRVGNVSDVKEICQKIVADFDGRHLEPSRRNFEKARNSGK